LTGSEGLIGACLAPRLRQLGTTIVPVDLRTPDQPIDLRDHARLSELVSAVDGIVHFGAVSRVVEGQEDPARCWAVNVDATKNLLDAALAAPHGPWFLYASSREVYGQQDIFPVREDADHRPINVYARSKVAAEHLCSEARLAGLRTAVVRFSSVYGSPHDHKTRVIPAFLRAAIRGDVLRVEGIDHTFDLTHVDDVTGGLVTLIDMLSGGETALPPIHFASGIGVTLLDLAQRSIGLGDSRASVAVAPQRTYDIHHFVGSTDRARELLGWSAATPLDQGLAQLAAAIIEQEATRAVPA